jgi:hypothetical protein
LKSKDAEYEALHKPVVPEGENKPLSQEVRTADELHILREDVLAEDETIEVGDVFLSEDGGTSFRVALITDNPINIAVIYTCETAPILE